MIKKFVLFVIFAFCISIKAETERYKPPPPCDGYYDARGVCCPRPGGCDDTPENPTIVLAGLSIVVLFITRFYRHIHRRKEC